VGQKIGFVGGENRRRHSVTYKPAILDYEEYELFEKQEIRISFLEL
jgi:hypothetical protein